ncbi:MAG: hypothetical protein ACP5TK_02605 [Candidatus Micrarchaeia archaeon]
MSVKEREQKAALIELYNSSHGDAAHAAQVLAHTMKAAELKIIADGAVGLSADITDFKMHNFAKELGEKIMTLIESRRGP